ncbi:uncharacterized protein LOC111700718 isoform X2 [Eurytemora carolleeae]|uniref:uncharacterized protein LOC111700718 isoform X2 n=1 Tax=Eurytemora carolleeae TaxID=1294199 RepID=UPI000C755F08|nr:uncharacterized protein LOC111700718 isoform X2 [Eurytemora carolleeae]|eukprot:XP_023327497.1 uncharacterized protein LOC111700718 isoform X2 [Eurytemora affinis]
MKKAELRVPDGGWGWYVLAAAATANFLVCGVNKSFSITIVEVVKELGVSPSQAGGIPSITNFCFLSSSPFASMLCFKFSFRKVAAAGATLSASGLILSGFFSSIYLQYICLGVLHGLGAGFIFTAGFLCSGTYFDKYKGFGNAICLAGNCLGGMVLPFLFTYLYQTFGYSGAHLILGGIMMHCYAATLVFQPVDKYMIKELGDDKSDLEESSLVPVKALLITNELENVTPCSSYTSRDHSFSGSSTSSSSHLYFAEDNYQTVTQNNKGILDSSALRSNNQKPVFPPLQEMWNSQQIQAVDSNFSLKGVGVPVQDVQVISSIPERQVKMLKSRSRLSSLTSSVAESFSSLKMSDAYLGSSVSLLELEAAKRVEKIRRRHRQRLISERSIKEEDDNIQTKVHVSETVLKADPNHDPNHEDDLDLTASFLNTDSNTKTKEKVKGFDLSYVSFCTFLPSYAIIHLGMEPGSVNILVAVLNGCDLFGRLSAAILVNKIRFKSRYVYILCMALSGLAMAILGLNTRYYFIVLVSCFIGALTGLHIGVAPNMQGEELGTDQVRYSYPLQYLAQGFISLIGPVSVSLLADALEFASAYLVLGSILCAGSAVFALFPFAEKYENNKLIKSLYCICKVERSMKYLYYKVLI